VTVPVADEDVTVAVRVNVSSTMGVVVEAERMVVVDVVDAFQKSPQPVRKPIVAIINDINAIALQRPLFFIARPRSLKWIKNRLD
jgi:hypothetical protein